jgi:hypothetical protein
MPIDDQLLEQARTAEARLIDAERDAEVTRAEFHRAVRRLQLAGGSLREIAYVLGISHQRVHQIIEGAGGARPWRTSIRVGRKRGEQAAESGVPGAGGAGERPLARQVACSFCGRDMEQVMMVIAGPGVAICNECVTLAGNVIVTGQIAATPLSAVTSLGADGADVTGVRCSFCAKRPHQVSGLAGAAAGAICTECLALCREIIAEEPSIHRD